MKLIAHRGNINGPNQELENSPDYLLSAIDKGYDVEVDIWLKNNIMYFGHDKPQHVVMPEIFYKIRDYAWFHCKNIEALSYFIKFHSTAKFFWHQQDDYTLTSSGHIWTYPGKISTNKSIMVDLNNVYKYDILPYGVCSDYVSKIEI